jgi:hypothetical protein
MSRDRRFVFVTRRVTSLAYLIAYLAIRWDQGRISKEDSRFQQLKKRVVVED